MSSKPVNFYFTLGGAEPRGLQIWCDSDCQVLKFCLFALSGMCGEERGTLVQLGRSLTDPGLTPSLPILLYTAFDPFALALNRLCLSLVKHDLLAQSAAYRLFLIAV